MNLYAESPKYDTWGELIAEDLESQRRDAEDDLHNEATGDLATNKDALSDFLIEVAQDWFALPDAGEEKFAAHPFMRLAFAERRDAVRPVQQALEVAAQRMHIESAFIEGEIR